MTRETKIGLIVAGSFLCLVGIVVASKWNRGDATDAEEQTVVPGAVLHPTQNSTDTKPIAKIEPAPSKPAPVTALVEKGKGTANEHKAEDAKSKGTPEFPHLLIPAPKDPAPGVDPVQEQLRNLIAQNKEAARPPIDPLMPLPTPGGASTLPPGGLAPLPTPGGAGTMPPGGLAPLPTPPGGLAPLPTPGGAGTLPPGGILIPPPLVSDPKIPAPDLFAKDGANKPARGTFGAVEFNQAKPFEDKTPIPDLPKPAPFDPVGGVIPPKQIEPAPALKGSPFGPLAPLPDPAKPSVPQPGDSFDVPPFRPVQPAPGPIAVIPPAGGVVLPAAPIIVGGGVRPLPAVKDVNTDLYECQKGDTTFTILSLRMYGTDKYADALLEYNREHSGMVKNGSSLNVNPPILGPGQQVLKPPPAILDRDYRALIRTNAPPQVKMDAPTPLTPSGPIAKVSNPPVPGPGGIYTVQSPSGESILDIAERVYGDRSQWHKIYRVNPNYPPQNRIPAGTQLTLPSS